MAPASPPGSTLDHHRPITLSTFVTKLPILWKMSSPSSVVAILRRRRCYLQCRRRPARRRPTPLTPAPPFFSQRRRRLVFAFPLPFLRSSFQFLLITMADAVIPKIDDALDTGSNTKSENLPVHVTSIRLNKDNYLSWSAALEIGITSRGRLHYITGERPAPSKTDQQWATWALEDSQEWMDRTFIFLGGLRDEFESIRSQILNCDEIPGIEEVYARVESEEQRRQIMHIDPSQEKSPAAFVSHTSGTEQRPTRRCSHYNKVGHSVDLCWDLHPEKRLIRGRPPSNRRASSVPEPSPGSSNAGKSKLSSDQLKELQAYISRESSVATNYLLRKLPSLMRLSLSPISPCQRRRTTKTSARKHTSQFDPISLENFDDLESWIEEEPATIFDNEDLECFNLEAEAEGFVDEGESASGEYVGEDLQILDDEDEEEDGDEDDEHYES
ncbi:hypothetical protein EJ110_NYTH50284 [Nymphaea thermarum]|nr:hypothetical protein EJ110_NYTH50284 [Nymphaea thermarum]